MMQRLAPYTVERSYAGIRLKVQIADPMAKGWYDHDWASIPEIDLLRSAGLKEGSRVFDLGAHQGVVAMLLAHAVGPSGSVVAVEALPHNARVAEINRDMNGLRQIHVEAAAISDQCGELEVCTDLCAQVRNAATNIASVRVPAVTVDELAARFGFPDVLFVDVEGYECHALRGAKQTLSRRVDCFVEVHGDCGLELAGGSREEIFDLLPANDFQYRAWTEGSPTPLPVQGPKDCPSGRFFLLAIPCEAASAGESK